MSKEGYVTPKKQGRRTFDFGTMALRGGRFLPSDPPVIHMRKQNDTTFLITSRAVLEFPVEKSDAYLINLLASTPISVKAGDDSAVTGKEI